MGSGVPRLGSGLRVARGTCVSGPAAGAAV